MKKKTNEELIMEANAILAAAEEAEKAEKAASEEAEVPAEKPKRGGRKKAAANLRLKKQANLQRFL